MDLLQLAVSLRVTGIKRVEGDLERVEKKSESTNRSLEKLRANMARPARFEARAEAKGFVGLLKNIADARRQAARPATFNVEAEAEGFGEVRSEVQRTRAQTSKAADFTVRARESGFGQVIGKVVQARAQVAKPADFTVRASSQGFSQTNASISRTSRGIDDLDGKRATLRTSLTGGDQVRAGLQAIDVRADQLDGASISLTTNLRNGRQVISELQGVDGVATKIDGDRVVVTAQVNGTQQGRAALQGLQAAASSVDGDDVRLSASITGTQSAIGELAALNSAASRVDGRNVRLNVDSSAVGILDRVGQGIQDLAQRVRNFQTIAPTVAFPGLLGAIGAIPGLATAAAAALGGLASAMGQALAGAAGIGGSALSGMAGGFGLILAAAQPTISAFSNMEQATNAVESAQKTAQSSADALSDAQRGVQQSAQGVKAAQEQAAQGVASAKDAYQDSLDAIKEAERGAAQAAQGVRDARREANEGVASAVSQYRDSLRGVEDAERALQTAARGVGQARREASEGVSQAQAQYRSSLQDVADRERDVAKASRDVKAARREAYEGVREAVRSYQDSVDGVRQAERDLEASRRDLGSASVDLWYAQQDLNEAMRDEPRNQAYATLDLADARFRAKEATEEYNKAVREYGRDSDEARAADLRRRRALLDLQAQEEETAEIRQKGSDQLNSAREGVINASEAETEARRQVRDSERALQKAREDASRSYEGIAAARREGDRKILEAQDQLASSQRALGQAQAKAAADQAAIDKARRDGAERVAQAQDQVTSATRALQDAQRKAASDQAAIDVARREGARGVADAQAQLAAANRRVQEAVEDSAEKQAAIEQARIDGARQVAAAQQALQDSQRRLARATRDNAAAQSELGKAASAVGAKLTASQARLLAAAKSFGATFSRLIQPANRAFNNLGVRILGVGERTLPALTRTAFHTVQAVSRAFDTLLAQWTMPRQITLFQQALRAIPGFTRLGVQSAGQLGTAVGNIFIAAIPQARRFLESLDTVTRRFNLWTSSAQGQNALQRFFARAAHYAKILGGTVVDLTLGVVGLGGAFDEAGVTGQVLTGLRNTARRFRELTSATGESRAGVVAYLRDTRPTIAAIGDLLGSLVNQWFRVSRAVLTARDASGKLVMPQAIRDMRPALKAIGDLLIAAFVNWAPLIGPAITQIARFMEVFIAKNPVLKGFAQTLIGLLRAFNNLPGPIQSAVVSFISLNAIFGVFGFGLRKLFAPLGMFSRALGITGGAAAKTAGPLTRLKNAFSTLGRWLTKIKTFLAPVGNLFMRFGRAVGTVLSRIGLRGGLMGILRLLGPRLLALGGPIGIAAAVIITLAQAFRAAYNRSETFRRIVNRVVGFVRTAFGAVFRAAGNAVRWLATRGFAFVLRIGRQLLSWARGQLPLLRRIFQQTFGPIGRIARGAFKIVMATARLAGRVLGGVFRGMGNAGKGFAGILRRVVGAGVRATAAVIRAVWGAVSKWWQKNNRQFANIARQVWRIIRGTISTGIRIIGNIIRLGLQVIARDWRGAGRTLQRIWQLMWRQIRRVADAGWKILKSVFRIGANTLRGIWNTLSRWATRLWQRFWRGLQILWRKGVRFVLNAVRDFVIGVRNAWQGLSRFATRLWTGFWRGLRKLWDSSLTAIGNRVRSWERAIRNGFSALGKWASRHWSGFWRGLRNLWDRALRAIGNRTESWRDALRSLMDRIAKWVRNRWDDFWRGLRGLWDRALRAVGNRTESWRDALRALMDRIAKWVRQRWDDFWRGLRGLWDRALRAIGNRTEAWRDALRNLFDRIAKWARSRWDSFWSGLRGLWDRSLTAIGDRLRSWGDATRRLFGNMVDAAKRFGDNLRDALVSRISSAVNRVRSWLGGLAIALGNVLSALGMDSAAENMKERGASLKEPLKMAKGGVVTHDIVHQYAKGGVEIGDRGGVGSGKRIVAITNEAGPEGVVPLNKRTPGGMEAMRAAAPRYGFRQVGGARGRGPKDPIHDHIPAYQGGGITGGLGGDVNRRGEQKRKKGIPSSYRIPRGTNPWMGRSKPAPWTGPTTWNWAPDVEQWIREITYHAGKGTAANTYKGHPGGEQNSVDWWGTRGRGQQIPVSAGDRILSYIKKNIPHKYTIWQGRYRGSGGGSNPSRGHFNHLHATLGGGGLFGGVMDALGNVYNSVKDFIAQKFKPPEIPSLGLGTFGKGLTDGLRSMVLGGARDWITKQAEERLSFGSSGGGGGGTIDFKGDWATAKGGSPAVNRGIGKAAAKELGWSGQWSSWEELGNRESGWDRTARNPSSGAYGIPQALPESKLPPEARSSGGSQAGPQIGWMGNYIRDRYNDPRGAIAFHNKNNWYEKGGVVPGRGPQPIVAHGGERILPASLSKGFEVLARALNRFSALGRGSALERVAQALTRALGSSRGLRANRPTRNRQHHTPRRSLSQRVRAWNDTPDAQRFRKGVPDELERDARAAGYSLAEDLTFVRSGFYGRTQRPRVQPRANRLPVNSSQVARNIQINAGMNTAALEREVASLKRDLVDKLDDVNLGRPSTQSIKAGALNTAHNFADSREGRNILSTQVSRLERKSRMSGRGI